MALTGLSNHIPFSFSAVLELTCQPFALRLLAEEKTRLIFAWQSVRARVLNQWHEFDVADCVSSSVGWELKFACNAVKNISFSLALTHSDNLLMATLSTQDAAVDALSIDFIAQPDEHYLGFGERFNHIDQRGQEIDLQVTNGASGGLAYKPIPFYMSSAGYGLRLLTSQRTKIRLACYDDPHLVSIRTENNQLSFQLWTGKPFAELLATLHTIIG